MNLKRKKPKISGSDLRSRLEEYSTLKEKARWPLPGEEGKIFSSSYLDLFPFSVLREMHRFLLFKITLALLVILLVFLMSFINIPFFATLLNNIFYVTTWQMDIVQAGRDIMPVVQQFWDGHPEFGLERPVVAPKGEHTPKPDAERESGLKLPVEGEPEIPFGLDSDGSMNYGLVFRVPPEAEVYAAMSGRVKEMGYHGDAGYYIVLEHPGALETIYGHLAELYVEERQEVAVGQVIGTMDDVEMESMENWFYFEVREDGKPRDPAPLFLDEGMVDN